MPAYKDPEKNTWCVKFQYKDWAGQAKWVTKRGFKGKREALKWEASFKERLSGSTDMSFADFISVYKSNRSPRIKESTLQTKENILDTKILPFFGEKRLCDISSTDVIQWQNELLKYRDPKTKKPYSASYLKTVHNQLSAIFNHAVRFYGLKENPARTAGNMGSDKDIQMNFWTKDEYLRFSEATMETPLAYYCFEVLYWCGLREGELLALTPADVDLEAGTIRINKTFQHLKGKDIVTKPKTPNSNRTIHMPDFLRLELKDYMNMCYGLMPDDRLFPVTKNYLSRHMTKGCKKAGVKKIRIHDLRHSHVSLLIDLGYSAVAIAERVGHQSIDITYRYAHLFPTVQSSMAEKLNDIREGEHVD